MSFVNARIGLSGSHPVNTRPLRMCDKCQRERLPEGGIQMNPTRWICAECWTKRAVKRPPA